MTKLLAGFVGLAVVALAAWYSGGADLYAVLTQH